MYGKTFNFSPTHKLIIYGNHLPGLRSVDAAIIGRIRIIPHLVKIRDTPLDIKGLDKLLIPEWPAILRWMIEGTQKWLRDGLKPPVAVIKATNNYFHAEDEIGGWLTTCCESWPADATDVPLDAEGKPTNYTLLVTATQSYDRWRGAGVNSAPNIKKTSPKSFGKSLREKGYETEHKRCGTVVWGLKIVEGPDEP